MFEVKRNPVWVPIRTSFSLSGLLKIAIEVVYLFRIINIKYIKIHPI
jgi:hypothetical protein